MSPIIYKNLLTKLGLFLAGFSLCLICRAQTYDTNNVFVQTLAGSAFTGYLDGQGVQTMFNDPDSIVADTSGNLFVLDFNNARIRKIDTNGLVTTYAGTNSGSVPGYGTNISIGGASFGHLAIDHTNAVWFLSNLGLLKANPDGYVSKIAATLTGLGTQSGMCFDSLNNLYYSYPFGNKIYRWRTNGVLDVFAGSGNPGSLDGNGVFTSFSSPAQLAVDAADNIYVYDSGSGRVRRINQNQDVTTIAGVHGGNADGLGTNAGFSTITAMCADGSGNILMTGNNWVRKMDAQTNVTTLAGSFSQNGYTNGVSGNLARFSTASSLCIYKGNIYVADSGNQRIRQITFNPSAQPVQSANLNLAAYPGLQIIGIVGRTYQIQSSPDASLWTPRQTILLNTSPYLWIDSSPVTSNQFYRAFLLP